jgi:predicted AAA+ superfamily ATPase
MYSRYLKEIISKRIDSGKTIVVVGPRQAGKTTLIESILASKEYLLLDGDDILTSGEPDNSRRLILLKSMEGRFMGMNLNGKKRKTGDSQKHLQKPIMLKQK